MAPQQPKPTKTSRPSPKPPSRPASARTVRPGSAGSRRDPTIRPASSKSELEEQKQEALLPPPGTKLASGWIMPSKQKTGPGMMTAKVAQVVLARKCADQFSQVGKAFRDVDTDHSGTIDYAEFRTLLARYNIFMNDFEFVKLMTTVPTLTPSNNQSTMASFHSRIIEPILKSLFRKYSNHTPNHTRRLTQTVAVRSTTENFSITSAEP